MERRYGFYFRRANLHTKTSRAERIACRTLGKLRPKRATKFGLFCESSLTNVLPILKTFVLEEKVCHP